MWIKLTAKDLDSLSKKEIRELVRTRIEKEFTENILDATVSNVVKAVYEVVDRPEPRPDWAQLLTLEVSLPRAGTAGVPGWEQVVRL